MNDLTDQQLLRDYAERQSESAFTELVRRHVDLVYSAALRMVCDSHLAKDVTQAVFIALSKDAKQLTDRPILSGWLHRTAQNIASKSVRTEVRRRAREQEAVAMNELLANEPDAAWENIAPHLDTALGELSEPDRDALLLRYFERKSAREMAQTLNVSEEAAQKRVNRAVERLREFFSKRNVTIGASGLVVLISTNAVQAAPVGLIAAVSTASLFGTVTSATTAASTTLTTMNWINTKSIAAMLASVFVAGTGTYVVQQKKVTGLQKEKQNLQVQQKKLAGERDIALLAVSNDDPERIQKERSELLRLRNEVSLLRQQKHELERLREENRKLQVALEQPAKNLEQVDEAAEQQKVAARIKMTNAKQLVLGMRLYADAQQAQFPARFEEVLPYLEEDSDPNLTNSFELVYFGSLTNIKSPSTTIVVREKQAFENNNGKRLKTYGFADGHSEIKMEPNEGFEAWEKEHMIAPGTIP